MEKKSFITDNDLHFINERALFPKVPFHFYVFCALKDYAIRMRNSWACPPSEKAAGFPAAFFPLPEKFARKYIVAEGTDWYDISDEYTIIILGGDSLITDQNPLFCSAEVGIAHRRSPQSLPKGKKYP